MKYIASLIVMLAAVQAHLHLDFPTPRVDDEVGQNVGPCGDGANTPGVRAVVTDGKLKLKLAVGDSETFVTVNVGAGSNPETFPTELFSDFFAQPAWHEIPLDFNSIGLTNSDATVQIIADTDHGKHYICADLKIN
ncbi:hypothetical protein BC833DRAFT_619650 [Globomyces pollinis-pini]|nr:hypothetical protein BC833DRAFT_619650 [Globomyces pollinis-pini]